MKTTILTVKNNTIVLPKTIGSRLEDKTIRLTDNGLLISITLNSTTDTKKSGNAKSVLSALKSAIGVFPKNQDGLKYTQKIRKSWDNRLNRIYGRI